MIAERIAEAVRGRFADVFVARGEVTVVLGREELLEAMAWLRDRHGLRFGFLSSLSVTDQPENEPRFWVSYDLRSMEERHRIRLKVGVPGHDPRVPSVTPLFPAANWLEREQYDFYGVIFDGHPNLTRIMLPDDWEGHPLRKDEELGGVPTWFEGARMPPVDRRGMA